MGKKRDREEAHGGLRSCHKEADRAGQVVFGLLDHARRGGNERQGNRGSPCG